MGRYKAHSEYQKTVGLKQAITLTFSPKLAERWTAVFHPKGIDYAKAPYCTSGLLSGYTFGAGGSGG
jgi:hypothetical protein